MGLFKKLVMERIFFKQKKELSPGTLICLPQGMVDGFLVFEDHRDAFHEKWRSCALKPFAAQKDNGAIDQGLINFDGLQFISARLRAAQKQNRLVRGGESMLLIEPPWMNGLSSAIFYHVLVSPSALSSSNPSSGSEGYSGGEGESYVGWYVFRENENPEVLLPQKFPSITMMER